MIFSIPLKLSYLTHGGVAAGYNTFIGNILEANKYTSRLYDSPLMKTSIAIELKRVRLSNAITNKDIKRLK